LRKSLQTKYDNFSINDTLTGTNKFNYKMPLNSIFVFSFYENPYQLEFLFFRYLITNTPLFLFKIRVNIKA